mgnify:CR=1 FL=1
MRVYRDDQKFLQFRINAVLWGIVAAFVFLAGSFWFVQGVQAEKYRGLAGLPPDMVGPRADGDDASLDFSRSWRAAHSLLGSGSMRFHDRADAGRKLAEAGVGGGAGGLVQPDGADQAGVLLLLAGEQWLLEAFAPSCRRFMDVDAEFARLIEELVAAGGLSRSPRHAPAGDPLPGPNR